MEQGGCRSSYCQVSGLHETGRGRGGKRVHVGTGCGDHGRCGNKGGQGCNLNGLLNDPAHKRNKTKAGQGHGARGSNSSALSVDEITEARSIMAAEHSTGDQNNNSDETNMSEIVEDAGSHVGHAYYARGHSSNSHADHSAELDESSASGSKDDSGIYTLDNNSVEHLCEGIEGKIWQAHKNGKTSPKWSAVIYSKEELSSTVMLTPHVQGRTPYLYSTLDRHHNGLDIFVDETNNLD
eukprot:5115168-Ditylum_brightwellii.AAC.1